MFPFYIFIKQAKQRQRVRYKLTHSQLEANMTTSVLECILRTNVREFKRFAKQTHGNQYKLIHLRIKAKTATSVLECILRAMFVNSNVLQPRSRPRVKRQCVFALTFMANIHSRLCSLYTPHLQFFQWSCYMLHFIPRTPPPFWPPPHLHHGAHHSTGPTKSSKTPICP